MRRFTVNVSEDLADRLSSQANQESRPLKWHIVYLLERAADNHARELAGGSSTATEVHNDRDD